MSKITFRADDDLVDAVEALDASKSEIMRDALRRYLETDSNPDTIGHRSVEESLDDIVTRKVESILAERTSSDADADSPVNVYIEVDGAESVSATSDRQNVDIPETDDSLSDANANRHTSGRDRRSCAQCGSSLEADHVYCPNCGEHAARTFSCECGEELRPDWSFCPGCGRRTATAEFLER